MQRTEGEQIRIARTTAHQIISLTGTWLPTASFSAAGLLRRGILSE
jgi:hypothetical protein